MNERVKTAEVRQRLGDLLDRVVDRQAEFVIERRGKPLAAIVPIEKLERMQRAAEVELLSALEQHARRITQKQVDEISDAAKHRSRRHHSKRRS